MCFVAISNTGKHANNLGAGSGAGAGVCAAIGVGQVVLVLILGRISKILYEVITSVYHGAVAVAGAGVGIGAVVIAGASPAACAGAGAGSFLIMRPRACSLQVLQGISVRALVSGCQ